jgi:1-acyl-sn-glycerol-3-phosphate acyltransferase
MLFRIVFAVARWFMAALVAAVGGLRVTGRENVGAWIMAANHESYLDPPVVSLALGRQPWYMAKEPLFRIPVLGAVLRLLRSFPVRADAPDRSAIRQAEEILGRGEPLVIFPEGSCSRDGELLPFRPGLAMIALRSGACIIPTAVIGTGRALPPDDYRLRRVPGGLEIRFGTPIDPRDLPPGLERKKQVELLTERVQLAIRELLGRPVPGGLLHTGSSSGRAEGEGARAPVLS